MLLRNFIYLSFSILFISSHGVHAMYEAFEKDLEDSKKMPLISGIDSDEIIKKGKAAITVCTTPIKGIFDYYYDHVSLVFEIKHPEKKEINLFSVHFGGDGHSSNIEEGRPIFDNAYDTLIKVYRGKITDYIHSTDLENLEYTKISPIYSRKILFVVDNKAARYALGEVDNDTNLQYSLLGGWGKKTYNCCTYANKVLKDAGIDTGFDSYFIKHPSYFIAACENYKPISNQESKTRFQPFNYANKPTLTQKMFEKDSLLEDMHHLDVLPKQEISLQLVHYGPHNNELNSTSILVGKHTRFLNEQSDQSWKFFGSREQAIIIHKFLNFCNFSPTNVQAFRKLVAISMLTQCRYVRTLGSQKSDDKPNQLSRDGKIKRDKIINIASERETEAHQNIQ